MQKTSRRAFLRGLGTTAGGLVLVPELAKAAGSARRPNVILIMTDDQGYGDLGCHGNEHIKTPNLDRLHAESVRFDSFYVCPVCSPTRACLMTGRYNYRTGAIDTYLGRSMMHGDEVTVAEMLGAGGYQTAIFGKWHLGDNHPMRAVDQGFHESVVHRGGGLCQPSDWPGNTYFDPILSHNGHDQQYKGYCTDIYTDQAIRFIEARRDRPFFVCLSTNAPHTPLQIGDSYVQPYLDAGIDNETAKVYGMITNIDDNVGRLLTKLKELGLEEDTIVIFLTDNGPQGSRQGVRWNAGLRAAKGSAYEGGIRVPFFVRWPGRLEAGKQVDRIGAHIDVLPTLLEACGVAKPEGVQLDGRSLWPLITGEDVDWPDRTLYFQWHRGDAPEMYRACAARGQRYKLVNGEELYDITNDPGEKHDIAAEHPDVVAEMRAGYEAWFKDVSATRGYAPPRIHIGTPHENPAVLTRQDWRGAEGWGRKDLGYWLVHVASGGNYDVTLTFDALEEAGPVRFKLGDATIESDMPKGATACTFDGVSLPKGNARIDASMPLEGARVGVWQISIRKV
ncbi:MAG TPA: arylsulfatase [Candidatus Hydrogenedentes bacterium]|nr:arylsulfatase [Candidatus Hydrogenedentota bacterium]